MLCVAEMRIESDWLWRTAVPQLRQFCVERSITFLLIDLPRDLHYIASRQPPSSLSSLSASVLTAWNKSLRHKEILQCQSQSIGPDFVVHLHMIHKTVGLAAFGLNALFINKDWSNKVALINLSVYCLKTLQYLFNFLI